MSDSFACLWYHFPPTGLPHTAYEGLCLILLQLVMPCSSLGGLRFSGGMNMRKKAVVVIYYKRIKKKENFDYITFPLIFLYIRICKYSQ